MSLELDEKKIRREQILKSYNNMKKQAGKMYSSIIASKSYKFPCSMTNYKQDAWNRNFTYNRIDDANAELSFNLPWSVSSKKVYPMSLPAFPVEADSVKEVITYSYYNVYLLTTKGDVWVAGRNAYLSLGVGNVSNVNKWIKTNLKDVKILKIGGDYATYAVTNSGELWVAGENDKGSFGLGHENPVIVWEKTSLTDVKDIFAHSGGSRSSYALTNSGDIWVAGYHHEGQLGIGNNANIIGPGSGNYTRQTIWYKTDLSNIKEIKVDFSSVYALTNNGEVWVAGRNQYGQLGIGNKTDQHNWVKTSLSDIKDIEVSLNNYNIYALTNAGKVWVAGYNQYGSLGIGNTSTNSSWKETTLTDVKSIHAARYMSAYALTNAGKVWVTGRNNKGQLGLGDTVDRKSWEETSLSNIKSINTTGAVDAYAVDNNGEVWVAGDDSYGLLGVNYADASSWIKTILTDVKEIALGYNNYNAYAVTNTGDVWVAGRNHRGQLGTGSSSNIYHTKLWEITTLKDIKKVTQGNGFQAYALTDEGELFTAGYNYYGQLGVGNTTNQESWIKTIGEGATDISGAAPSCP